jgi:hypothetical protein
MRNATRIVATTFGVLAGLAGLEHGIGETLQGNIAPNGMMIESWPESETLRILGGEPAMTIIPNLLVTGVLAILVSLVLLVWAVAFVQRKHGGLILILLSVILLLVGGGFGPPLQGIIAGVTGTRINASFTWWQSHLSLKARHFLARLWPWSFAACLAAWLLLFPGTLVIGHFFPLLNAGVIYTLILLAFGSLLLTLVIGFVHDSYRQTELHQTPAMGR